jgi:5-formyltetrahydrofolate cyclo-ligase
VTVGESGGNSAKVALRDQLLTARNRRSLAERSELARGIADQLLAAPEVRRAASVAAYVSVGSEPGTGGLLR